MTLQEQKVLFAKHWLRMPKEPFKAALAIFPNDNGLALKASIEWVRDPFVLNEQAKLVEDFGLVQALPDKNDFARAVWELSRDELTDDENKIKALRLYGEIRGFIEKPLPVDTGKDAGGLVVNIIGFTQNNTQVNQAPKKLPEPQVAQIIDVEPIPRNSLVRVN